MHVKLLWVKDHWEVRSDETGASELVSAWGRGLKGEARKVARDLARRFFEVDNRPSQLVIHSMNGRIQREFTYGQDPERFPG